MAASSQLRVLTINEGENRDTQLFRLEKGWTFHLTLGPNLADKNVRLFTNHPEDSKCGPNRNLYREIKWRNLTGSKLDVYDNFAEVPMVMAGSFNYYFTIDGSDKVEHSNGCGIFLVDPILRVGQYDEKLPLDCITCQTVLAKSLGPFDEWEDRLRVAKESGYNMIHFTPLQELGASNSCYCLKDHMKLNSVFSRSGKQYTFEDVDRLVTFMKNEWDTLSLTDLVYNHTANESPWIQEHPECAYNVVNSPHLKPAYLLDRILWHFTLDVSDGKFADKGVPPEVRSGDHLNAIRRSLSDEMLPKFSLHEYFLMHIDDTVQQFKSAALSGRKGEGREGNQLVIVPDPRMRRLKSTVNMTLALQLYLPDGCSGEDDPSLAQACGAFRAKIEELNHIKYVEVASHLEAAVTNFLANINWRFLDPNGPKTKLVSAEEPLAWNYFVLVKDKMSVEEEEAMMHSERGVFCMAHNGWVMNDDPLRNFAEAGSNVYLRRELIPWGDSVKLRYGERPEDCPYLWQHMRDYTVSTAKIFHGIRLDNCHSTPIHVAQESKIQFPLET